VGVDVHSFRIVPDDSGPVNYYKVMDDPAGAYIHSAYRWPYETSVLGWAIPDGQRRSVAKIRWKWRAVVFPDEKGPCPADTAAVTYITWKRGMRWYVLRYVWAAVGAKGSNCDRRRNLFKAQDTVLVEVGGPLNEWHTFEIDPDLEFRRHFEDGNPNADVPEMAGIGLMSDGDQTHSSSEADWSGIVVTFR